MTDHTPGFTEGPDFRVHNIPPAHTGFTEHVDYTVLAASAWAPPGPPPPPAPKKSRPWIVPAVCLAAVVLMAVGIGTTFAASGDPPAQSAATTPGGCYGQAPGDKFVCRDGKWLYSSAPAPSTPRTTVPDDDDYLLIVIDGLIDDMWNENGGGDLCDSLNEVVASGLSRRTALQLAHTQWASEDYGAPEYQDYIVAALDAKTAEC